MGFATVDEALEALKNGEIIVVTDDPDRENEGDTICAAEFATTENINFMACHAKGLICMPMSSDYVKKLGLTPMVSENTDNHCTAFTASIDHITTTTGISAVERSITAMRSVEDNAKPSDFRRPGHMFPLEARPGGVLERNGHTEATVDLMKLAGLKEVGLCCEIMADDGTMMRTTQLLEFADKHNLKFITIKDIQNYRRQKECFHRTVDANLPTKYGKMRIYGYEKAGGEHHVALVKGSVKDKENVLVRVHSECLTGDVFGSSKCDCGDQYAAAMNKISEEECGVLIYLRQEGRGIGLINKLRAYSLQDKGMDTVEANLALGFDADLRNYDCAAYILNDLEIKSIRLITNNPEKIKGLEKCGIKVNERINLPTPHKAECEYYMETKKRKMGHIL